MALDKNNLKQLMKAAAKADRSAPVAYSFNGQNFSYESLNETLRVELNELAGSVSAYRENKNLIFSIIEETLSEILPKKVQDAYGQFADVQTFNQGEAVIFRRKINARQRAKQFVTRVGLAGVYEVFKLGGMESITVPTFAVGGAAQVSIEEFLDGRVDFAEIVDIVMEGMDEIIYREVAKAMTEGVAQLPAANQVATNGFDEAAFDTLVAVAAAYGAPTIYCSYDFAVKMLPKAQWMLTDAMKEEIWNNGHFTNYKGTRVIILPNGFVDETNADRILDPGHVWIIPTGGEKPVKIAFEGDTMVREVENNDWSREFQVYKKVGVVAILTNNICSYVDTSLEGKTATVNIGAASLHKYSLEK